MKTELLMTVDYIFTDEKKGKRIVGGAKLYSTADSGWLDIMGKEVLIQTSSGGIYFKVIKVDVFSSIAGALNIGLTLDAGTVFESIDKGDQVFKIIDVE